MDFGYEKDSKERLPYEHYLKIYQETDPEEMSRRTGVPYDPQESVFTLKLLGVTYKVTYPGYQVCRADGEELGWFPLEEKANARILVLRFLTEGTAAPSAGKFLTYREVPWGEVYFKQFQGRCLARLAFGFGNRQEGFAAAMERLGAKRLSFGDISYELEFMEGLQVRLILWAGDEEFPPSAQILFADNLPVAFRHGEDLVVVADVVLDALKALAASAGK